MATFLPTLKHKEGILKGAWIHMQGPAQRGADADGDESDIVAGHGNEGDMRRVAGAASGGDWPAGAEEAADQPSAG